MTSAPRRLVVNADDFGLSSGVNRGIALAYDVGLVTSTSLMVKAARAADAVRLAAERPGLALGIHIDLGEWIFEDGEWKTHHHVVDLEDADAVAREVDDQLAAFTALVGRPPTHLDSHQHVHRDGATRDVMVAAATSLGVPLRNHGDIAFHGEFYGQSGEGRPLPQCITHQALVALLRSLGPGTSELGCHPGFADPANGVYDAEREAELHELCDPRARRVLDDEGIELCSFCDLG